MWRGFTRSRKELMCSPSAGQRSTHAHCLTMIFHTDVIFVIFSGAIAGTPLEIDRELLRKGQAVNILNVVIVYYIDHCLVY